MESREKKSMLIGKNIFLRLMEKKDVPDKVKWVNDPEIRHMLIMDLISEAGTELWFSRSALDGSRKEFMICLTEDGEPIGFTSLKNIDRINSKAEISMLIGRKDCWGHGYAKEARKLILAYAFNELGMNKVYTFNWVKNEKIIGLNKRLGFKLEGVLRADIFFKGEYRDMAVMSMLKDEWKGG
jgi:RimJ/RimL family protein N-acetyltransferase